MFFLLYVGKKRLTFEPDLRFSLEGQPRSMLFWWRYRLIQNEKFSLRVGAHPAINFRTIPAVSNGKFKEVIEARSFVASEIVPSYALSKNTKVGVFYLFGIGFDDSQKYSHCYMLNSAFPDIRLADEIMPGIVSQRTLLEVRRIGRLLRFVHVPVGD